MLGLVSIFSKSDDRDQRDQHSPVVAVNTGGAGIKRGLAVHQEAILVMALAQEELAVPPAIRALLHGNRAPLVKITCNLD